MLIDCEVAFVAIWKPLVTKATFVERTCFDQRVALRPPPNGDQLNEKCVVGKCVEYSSAFDELSGSRLCTVCRDHVLVCENCQSRLREFHCRRHAAWKSCYFTFLEVFSRGKLVLQKNALIQLCAGTLPAVSFKKMRRTLQRQIGKVQDRMRLLDSGDAVADPEAPSRCRTCMEVKKFAMECARVSGSIPR